MTTGFHQLALDDTVQLKGPLGSFIWNGQGLANWKGSDRKVKEYVEEVVGIGRRYWAFFLMNWNRDHAHFASPPEHLP